MSLIQKMIVETKENPTRRGIVVSEHSEFVTNPETNTRELTVMFGVTFPDEEKSESLCEFFDNENLTPITAYDTADDLAIHTCPECGEEFRTEDETDDDGEEEEEEEEEEGEEASPGAQQ
jgi:hypothetical protein